MKNKKILILICILIVALVIICMCLNKKNNFINEDKKNDDITEVSKTTSRTIVKSIIIDENDENAYQKFVNNQNEETIKKVEISKEDRKTWNELLNQASYLQKIDTIYPLNEFQKNIQFLYIALYSESVKKEDVTEEEMKFLVDPGMKKSRKDIDNYLYSLFGWEKNSFNYGSVETFIEDDKYLIVGDDYVYFTELEPLEEKMYLVTDYKISENYFSVYIYEYNVTEENRADLEEMLESGTINNKYEKTNEYTIIGKEENGQKVIKYKYKNREAIDEIDSQRESIFEDVTNLDESDNQINDYKNENEEDNKREDIE